MPENSLMNKTHYKRLGDYIREVDTRNCDLTVTKLMGINIGKFFMPSVANVIGTDLSNYKVVFRNCFACNLMHVGRDEKIPIALHDTDEKIIISPAYFVFEISKPEELLPAYLMMWFRRREFDRNAWFYTDSDVRGGMSRDAFCDLKLPIPPISRQREIVAEYETLTRRIRLNELLISSLESAAQTLYRRTFVDNIDPAHLPPGWRTGTLGDVCEYVTEKVSIDLLSEENYVSTENMLKNRKGITRCENLPEDGRAVRFKKGDILVSNIRPYFKKIWKANFDGGCSNDVLCLRAKGVFSPELLYYTIERDCFFDYVMSGSNGVKMPRGDKEWIMKFPVTIPTQEQASRFEYAVEKLRKNENINLLESLKLREFQFLMLVRLC